MDNEGLIRLHRPAAVGLYVTGVAKRGRHGSSRAPLEELNPLVGAQTHKGKQRRVKRWLLDTDVLFNLKAFCSNTATRAPGLPFRTRSKRPQKSLAYRRHKCFRLTDNPSSDGDTRMNKH